MTKPILSLKNIEISFGEKIILNNLDMNIYQHNKICLIGKNGEGKSTLLKIIYDEYIQDKGERWIMPGLQIGYLPQQFFEKFSGSVEEFLLSSFKNDEFENGQYKVDIICDSLQIEKSKYLNELSGGQLRRVYLAKALIAEPDLILLDEPTNHLDILAISWLEKYLETYEGAVICISHDRAFLTNISNKIIWLDQGKILTLNKGYAHFDEWSISVYEQRQRELNKLSKKLVEEEEWQHGGVTARRKRNQRRLGELHALRERLRVNQTSNSSKAGKIDYNNLDNFKKSKLILEVNNLSYNITGKPVIKNFNLVISKGEKIGLIGPNGCGKTTLLNLMVGDLAPDEGRVKLAKNTLITYYDQKRIELDPDESLWSTLCQGGDHLIVNDAPIHVVTYLKRFMFNPKNARDKTSTLSGGQANRLMLAKVLANPGSLLILDEPTNDLDMDTLDVIQEILSDYKGTLIIVSHDRDFLDRIITKSLIFDGSGNIQEYYGSYQDYVQKNTKKNIKLKTLNKVINTKVETIKANGDSAKLSFKIKHELENLPNKISKLEDEIQEIETELNDSNLYTLNPDRFNGISKTLVNKKAELNKLWERWQELEQS